MAIEAGIDMSMVPDDYTFSDILYQLVQKVTDNAREPREEKEMRRGRMPEKGSRERTQAKKYGRRRGELLIFNFQLGYCLRGPY